jgi:membrane protein YqaA with SNARE-associated domain
MIASPILAALKPTVAHSVRRWVVHLGGLGLIPLGLLDNSIVPLPGSMDVVLIILCARQEEWWFYYALMATAGGVIGGYVTYRLARKGGKQALERRFPPRQVAKVNKIFERWGFSAIAVPALLPPPAPFTLFLIAAGAMQYPLRKFLAALAAGRVVRYVILGYLSARYGRKIIGFIAKHGHPVALTVIVVAIAAVLVALYYWRGSRRSERTASQEP